VDSAIAQQANPVVDPQVEQEASELFNKVMSPFCPGRTIANCPSPQAAELQVSIKEKLSEGESPEQIEAELYATFGDDIRAIPRARGFNLLAWVVPGLFFVLGVFVVGRWLAGPKPAIAGASSVTEAGVETGVDERVQQELAQIDD
jgi:cytochrome c-type biogenesis protein CcmH/NrfF